MRELTQKELELLHSTKTTIARIQALHQLDPDKWTARALMEQFRKSKTAVDDILRPFGKTDDYTVRVLPSFSASREGGKALRWKGNDDLDRKDGGWPDGSHGGDVPAGHSAAGFGGLQGEHFKAASDEVPEGGGGRRNRDRATIRSPTEAHSKQNNLMKDERKERIVDAIAKHMKRKDISQNKLSTELGFISGPQLSNVMNRDKWSNVGDGMWQRLAAKFLGGDWKIYETSNYRAIQRICADMQKDGEVVAIGEYTGAGKSVSAEAYCNNTPNAFYLECNQLLSKKDLVREIQKMLGIYTEGRIVEMLDDITDHLAKLEAPLLLIDEADKLSDANLLLLKVIYDRLEFRCGFLVMGTPVLRERIEKNSKRNKLGWRELKRRFFTTWRNLRPFNVNDAKHGKVVKEEIEFICADQGITSREQVERIIKEATNWGEVRNMIRAYHRINTKALEKNTLQPEFELA